MKCTCARKHAITRIVSGVIKIQGAQPPWKQITVQLNF